MKTRIPGRGGRGGGRGAQLRNSSSREEKDVVESYRLGVNSYVVKPVTSELFSTTVQELGTYWLQLNQPPKLGGLTCRQFAFSSSKTIRVTPS